MATTSRVTPWGWDQGDDSADSSRVTPGGWEQVVGAGGSPTVTRGLRNLILPWDAQPQESAGIDWGNPISEGLVAASIAEGAPSDLTAYTNANGFTPGVGSVGRVANILAASTQNFEYSGASRVVDAPFTAVALVMFPTLVGGAIFTAFETTASYHELYITGTGVLSMLTDGATSGGANSSAGTVVAGQWAVLGGRVDSGSGSRSSWKNGVLVGSNATSTGAVSATSNRWGTWNGTTERMTGAFALRLLWKRALTDAEMAEIGRNPWQLFAPSSIWLPTYSSASGVPLLSFPTLTSIGMTTARPRVSITF